MKGQGGPSPPLPMGRSHSQGSSAVAREQEESDGRVDPTIMSRSDQNGWRVSSTRTQSLTGFCQTRVLIARLIVPLRT